MSPMADDMDRSPMSTGFLDLPYELRHQVYRYWIPRQKNLIYTSWVSHPSSAYSWLDSHFLEADFSTVNVLQLSKQISEECLDILYGENIFHVSLKYGGQRDLRNSFMEKNKHRVRRLTFTAESHRFPPGSNGRLAYDAGRPDKSLWATLLPNLKSLWIIVKQPTKEQRFLPTLILEEEDIAEWAEWASPHLQCLGKYIPETLQRIVDDDNREAARQLVEKYLSSSCQLQRASLDKYMSDQHDPDVGASVPDVVLKGVEDDFFTND